MASIRDLADTICHGDVFLGEDKTEGDAHRPDKPVPPPEKDEKGKEKGK
ncbi:hypothetical protein AGRA3207_002781 [Actinomadura graeca]|uniref:Uncharacterized protein n=1 Tax=Actinomadura graeca TaxID=2750812 RepID=A0ABX8QSS1_9ACTN|nr:hypothetical protein [Actinomadura graeca]QXJ21876.1 hypothetical protein AGRA3207_002781 [Actinomadura graeca]